MGATFEFLLFGAVEARRAGGRVSLGEPRQRCIAAVLLTEANRVVSAGSLVERVWSEPPASARSALYSYLARIKAILRRLDPDGRQARLVRAAGGYLLEVDPDTVDLHRFRRLVDQARTSRDLDQAAARWTAALDLWRGDPYEDLSSPWLDQTRDALEQQRLAAMSERNDVELARGRHAQLLAELTDQCQRQPFDERLAGQLMLAAYRCGRQAEAIDHYQTVRRRLNEELGVDPGQDLSTLYEQILRHDPALTLPPSRTPGWMGATLAQLPPDVPGFAGRTDALAGLDALLTRAEHQPSTVVISALSGTAGVGKTTLAVHWAHQVADQFPDGQLYIDLRGFGPGGSAMAPAEAVRRFLDALQVPPERIPADLDAQAALYRSQMAGRRMLLVLDNAHDSAQVRPLLPAAPTCLVVVTSRNELSGLIAAAGAHSINLDVLSVSEARELLTQRLGAGLVAAEPDAAEEIITRCARLPLALALVAAHAATHPRVALRVLAAELADAGQRWQALTGDDPHTDVRAVFSWSYQALTPAAARLFRLLGLHPGPDISAWAAASLAGLAPDAVRPVVAELTRANLLTEPAPGRYTFHDLLRDYATHLAGRIDTDEQRQQATGRILDHYLHTANPADRLLNPTRYPVPLAPPRAGVTPQQLSDYEQAMGWFTVERQVLLAAVAHAAGNGFDAHTWQLAWSLWTFLHRQGHWHDQTAVGQAAVAAAQRLADPTAQGRAHRLVAVALIRLGRFDDARTQLHHALDLATHAGDQTQQAHTHHRLAVLWEGQGQPAQALPHAQRALHLFQATGDEVGQADALNAAGWCHALLGEHQQALTYCQQALTLYQHLGSNVGQAETWDSLGHAHHHLGHHTQAVTCYQQALTLFQDLGDRYYEATILTHLGDTHQVTGHAQAARDVWQRAVTILDDLDHVDAAQVRAKLATL